MGLYVHGYERHAKSLSIRDADNCIAGEFFACDAQEKLREAENANIPFLAAAAVWLCSDAASFVTGTVFVIDGGKLAGSPPFTISETKGSR